MTVLQPEHGPHVKDFDSRCNVPSGGQGASGLVLAEQLNSGCFCSSLDVAALRAALSTELGDAKVFELVTERCPYLFSSRPVFIAETQTRRIAEVIAAIESVIAMPAYRQFVLDHAPEIARHDPGGAKGVFFGYDFHLRDESVGLIEINTNAGGAMLNAAMAKAHRACCSTDAQMAESVESGAVLEDAIVAMFRAEWTASNRGKALATIAIVDAHPEDQYLYPEFLLFQQLFERHGLKAVIADPAAFEFRDGALWCGDIAIDLVYNRLTDFLLELPASASLRAAYLANAVVLTPHPQAHALYANKRNLSILTSAAQLQALGVPQAIQDVLIANIPATELVTQENAGRLWTQRRQLFFKPLTGYGGRAAYRGDKLTKGVWSDIVAGEYIAQALVRPGERAGGERADATSLKFDIRSYVYAGQVQWTAARVYQGQTTNFRTPGGGFAPVYSLPDDTMVRQIERIAEG
jgi:hypothetical protein